MDTTFITPNEIIDLARVYVDQESMVKFPNPNDCFAILARPVENSSKDDTGWLFHCYGICLSYSYQPDTQPLGKWIVKKYLNLATFPPKIIEISLQPPHIARGRYFDASRTIEFKIVTISPPKNITLPTEDDATSDNSNILKFPFKR